MELGNDFQDLLALLNRHGVRYRSTMTNGHRISRVVRKVRRDALDEDAEQRAYWRSRTPEERIAELESLRRLWPEITGDPDQPMARVVHRRRLGEPAIQRPR